MKAICRFAALVLLSSVPLSLSLGCGSVASKGSPTAPQSSAATASGGNGSSGTQSGAGSGSNNGASGGGSNSGSGSESGDDGNSGTGDTASGALSLVPANAVAVKDIQALRNWKAAYDRATSGGSDLASGIMNLVTAPSLSGQARSFATNWSSAGGERYSVSFGSDPAASSFLYDAWVYLQLPSNGIANLEFDMNQVLGNGQTVIYGFQCSGYSGTWEYTTNAGTPQAPVDKWVSSAQACNPRNWSTGTWHHVQISYSRDNSGNVTYSSVWLDNAEQPIHAKVPSSFALGWASVLLTNFQVDGLGTDGSATAYLDNLTVYRW